MNPLEKCIEFNIGFNDGWNARMLTRHMPEIEATTYGRGFLAGFVAGTKRIKNGKHHPNTSDINGPRDLGSVRDAAA